MKPNSTPGISGRPALREIERAIGGFSLAQIYPSGTELFQQGQPVRIVYLIQEGVVKLTRTSEDGREVIAGLRYSGWMLGAAAAILQRASAVTAVTATRCKARAIAAEDFRRALPLEDPLSRYVLRLQAEEIYDHTLRTCSFGLLRARLRLESLLWDFVVGAGGADRSPFPLQVPLKYYELAQMIGVSPQYLSELLAELEKDGIVRRQKGTFILLAPHRLWHQQNC